MDFISPDLMLDIDVPIFRIRATFYGALTSRNDGPVNRSRSLRVRGHRLLREMFAGSGRPIHVADYCNRTISIGQSNSEVALSCDL